MANRNIKGITIQLEGDATGLNKALSSVDKSIKTTSGNLKDINRLLKFDPGNTELLKQKQENLTKAIGDTKQRLETLKTAAKQANEQLANGQMTQDQYDALQREIVETEQKLKGLTKESKTFGSVGAQQIAAVGNKVKEVGDKMKAVGEGMTKYVTGPIAAVGGASVAAFKSVDEGYDGMIAKTGATGEAAGQLRDIMNDIATSIPTSFDTAGAAIGEVATRFGVTGDELRNLSEQFIKFSELNGTDVSSSIDSIQAAMTAFGVETESAGDILDIMNKVGQDTGISMDKLASELLANNAALQDAGMGFNEAANFLGNLDKRGIDSATALSGLKKAMANAAKEGKSTGDALAEVQASIMGAGTDAEAAQIAMDLFGAKGGASIAQMVRDGRLSLTDFSGAVQDWSDSVSTTFDETQDPIDKFQITLNQLKILGAEIATQIFPFLQAALEKVGEVIQRVSEWWNGLTEGQQQMIVQIAGLVAAIGPLLMIIGQVLSVIGSIMTMAPMLSTAMTALTGPIGLVVAAIAAAIAVGVLIYKNWDTIKEKALEIWGAIKDFLVNLWNGIKQTAIAVFNAIKDAIIGHFQRMRDMGMAIWNGLKNGIISVVNGIKNTVTNVFNAVKNAVTNIFNGVKNTVTTIWTNIKNGIANTVGNIKNTIVNGIQNAISWLTSLPSRALQWGRDLIQNFVNGITERISSVINTVSNLASTVASYIGFSEPDKGPLSKFHTFMPDMIALMVKGIEEGRQKVENAMGSLATGMVIEGHVNGSQALQEGPGMASMLNTLNQYLPYLANSQNIYLDTGALVGGTAPQMNQALGRIQLRERGR